MDIIKSNPRGMALAKNNLAGINRLFNGNTENVSGLLLCMAGVKPGFYGSFSSDPMTGTEIPIKELNPRMNALTRFTRDANLHIKAKEYRTRLAKILGVRWEREFLVCDSKDNRRVRLAETIFNENNYDKKSPLLGDFLGYPACCINHYGDPKKRRDMHTIGELQNFIGYKPCSDNCAESKRLGELYAKTIKELSEELFSRIKGRNP